MTKYTKTVVVIAVLFTFHVLAVEYQEKKHENAPKVVPFTTEEMQTPDFWINTIDGNPDEVILSTEKIAELNLGTRRIPEKIKKLRDINGEPYSIDRIISYNDKTGAQYYMEDPLALKTFPGDSLRARLRNHREYFDSRTFYDGRRMVIDEDKKNEWYEQTDAGSIPDVIIPRYGIITVYANNRVLPTNETAYGRAGDWYSRGLQGASADVAMPVAVLHETKDKDWYYVRTETAFGWVESAKIAIASAEEIRKYLNDKDCIVSLAHKVPVYSDAAFTSFVTNLYMSSRCQLMRKTDRGYHVQLPFRKPDGSLEIIDGWVKPDAKVSVGFQPFTRRNIINTLFSLLYRPYSWNDAGDEWNCCGYIRVVLRTFGILTGSWPAFQMHYSDHVVVFPQKTSREVKNSYLEKCEPGLNLVGADGHVLMYLGKVDSKYYVIHMGGYDYTGEDGTVMMFRRVNVNHTELEGSYNVDSFTKISTLKP